MTDYEVKEIFENYLNVRRECIAAMHTAKLRIEDFSTIKSLMLTDLPHREGGVISIQTTIMEQIEYERMEIFKKIICYLKQMNRVENLIELADDQIGRMMLRKRYINGDKMDDYDIFEAIGVKRTAQFDHQKRAFEEIAKKTQIRIETD